MNSDLYALIALAARYWFVALIAVLLFRGWRMTVADNRRAKLLREWMGQTGCVGELIANPGAKRHASYPIPREGVLGSARNADVRIRHRDIRRTHAHFELREGGLLLKPLGRAELKVGGGFTGDAVFLQDGDVLTIGRLQLMLVLFDASAEEEEEEDEWFEIGPDAAPVDEDEEEWYGAQSATAHARHLPDVGGQRPQARPAPKRSRKVPVSLDGQFSEKPVFKRGRKAESDVDLPFDLNPAPKRVRSAPGDAQSLFSDKPSARRTRTVPDDAQNWSPEKPATRRARAVPGDKGNPVFDRPAASRAPSGKPAAKGKRTRQAANGDAFDEDTIWPNL